MEMLPLKVYPRIIFVQSGDAISSDFSSQIGVVIFLENLNLIILNLYFKLIILTKLWNTLNA